jgi:hypothetical protein
MRSAMRSTMRCGARKVPERPSRLVIGGIGFLAPPAGGGYATEAVAAMVTLAAARGTVTTVVARTEGDNLPSRRVLQKIGFRFRPEVSGPFPHRVTSGGGRRVSAAMRKRNRRSTGHVSRWGRRRRGTGVGHGPRDFGRDSWLIGREGVLDLPK